EGEGAGAGGGAVGSRGEAAALRPEPAHHAPDRPAAEAAAAAEDDAVHGRHEVARIEVVEPDDVVRAASQLDAADRGAAAQHDGDAGEAGQIGCVADANARDVGDQGLRLTSAARSRPAATSPASSSARWTRARANG